MVTRKSKPPVAVQIRHMSHEDIPSVVAIERLCFGDRWSASAFATELENPSSTYVVALNERDVAGYAGFWLILEEAHITTIAVHPHDQGHKIGEQLLLSLIDESAKRGAKWMTLEVRVSNVVAQKLYEKYGFTALGKRRGYYQDDGEDALVMWTENIWQDAYQARLAALKASLLP
jgi:ribosomal-protein-alanine N-acetyltransferase